MKKRTRTSKQEIRFFCILGLVAISLAGASSRSHTMRAVSPDSIQSVVPGAAPLKGIDEEENSAEDLDFDDDFSVLV